MFNHATTAARDSAIAMIAGDNAAIIVANQSHLASLTAFRPAVHHHRNLEPGSMPDLPTRSDPFADDLFANDSAILVIASIAAAIIASNVGSDVTIDVTPVIFRTPTAIFAPPAPFSSRHSTPIAICHALASTADADSPPDTAPGPTRRYCQLDLKNSSKSKTDSKSLVYGPHADSAAADSAAAANSAAAADSAAAAESAAAADSTAAADFAAVANSAAS